MSSLECNRTAEILAAARSAAPPGGDAARHTATCEHCSAAVTAQTALTSLAAALARQASPPSAAQILFRSQLRQTAQAADRAVRPIRLWALAAGIGTPLAAGALLLIHASDLWQRARALQAAPAQPLLLLAGFVGVCLTGLLLHLHSAWTES